MFLGLSSSIQTLNAVAIGDKAADLVLENCSLVNVYTGEMTSSEALFLANQALESDLEGI